MTFSVSSLAQAREQSPVGLGIILGQPTGLVGKFWLDRNAAIDVGLDYLSDDYLSVYIDYLFHWTGSFSRSSSDLKALSPYLGIGGVLHSGGTQVFGIRIPLGLEWIFARPKIGIFAEIAPGVGVIPGTFGFVQGGIGARYYF